MDGLNPILCAKTAFRARGDGANGTHLTIGANLGAK